MLSYDEKLIAQYIPSYILQKLEEENLTERQREKLGLIKAARPENRQTIIHQQLASAYKNILAYKHRWTADEIQACVIDGLYFTEHELCEMLDEELSEKKPCNETIDKIIYCLENRIFFKTLEEAEAAEDAYWVRKIKESKLLD